MHGGGVAALESRSTARASTHSCHFLGGPSSPQQAVAPWWQRWTVSQHCTTFRAHKRSAGGPAACLACLCGCTVSRLSGSWLLRAGLRQSPPAAAAARRSCPPPPPTLITPATIPCSHLCTPAGAPAGAAAVGHGLPAQRCGAGIHRAVGAAAGGHYTGARAGPRLCCPPRGLQGPRDHPVAAGRPDQQGPRCLAWG